MTKTFMVTISKLHEILNASFMNMSLGCVQNFT